MPHVQIFGYFQSYSDIDCSFRKDVEASLFSLRIGQRITIIGRCTGMFLGVHSRSLSCCANGQSIIQSHGNASDFLRLRIIMMDIEE